MKFWQLVTVGLVVAYVLPLMLLRWLFLIDERSERDDRREE